jgi:type VI secretion system protein ImpN
MSGDEKNEYALVSARFSALWAVLGQAPAGEARRLMIDRVRDALDRGHSRLAPHAPDLIANSFSVDEIVYASERTLVMKLRHCDLGTAHALKTLPPDRRDDVVLRQWLLHEGRLAAALENPNIVAIRATLRLADGRPALLSDWMPATLSQCLRERAFAASKIAGIMRSLFSALGYLHAEGIVHGDISPANLLFADEDCGCLKIGDFGLALRQEERHQDLDMARGAHPDFAAPEQLGGARPELRSDLYSCGRILHELVERSDAGGVELLKLSALADQLMQPDPADRPEDAMAAAAPLEDLCRSCDL